MVTVVRWACQISAGYSLSCSVCPLGTVSATGIGCTMCNPGRGPNNNRSACEICPKGHYANCDTEAVCQKCEKPGKVNDDQSKCSVQQEAFQCMAGFFCPTNRLCRTVVDCQKCPAGSVSSTGQQCTECRTKGDGRASNPEQTECLICAWIFKRPISV